MLVQPPGLLPVSRVRSGADAGVAVDAPPVVEAGTPSTTYPTGPYGTAVGSLFRPFRFDVCNPSPDITWEFDRPDFFTSALTVVSICATWSAPCRNDAARIQSQIVAPYAGRGVRFVQLLVQGATPASTSCSGAEPVGATANGTDRGGQAPRSPASACRTCSNTEAIVSTVSSPL